jgi:hypothetical protein
MLKRDYNLYIESTDNLVLDHLEKIPFVLVCRVTVTSYHKLGLKHVSMAIPTLRFSESYLGSGGCYQ